MYNGLSDEYCPEHMRLLERRNVLTSPFINVYEDTVELPSVGARMDRYWVEPPRCGGRACGTGQWRRRT